MIHKIPIAAVQSEAAMIGAAALCRFIKQFPESLQDKIAIPGMLIDNPAIAEIKECFFIHLYQKLLSKEFDEILLPRSKRKTPYGEYLEMILESASRIILKIHQDASAVPKNRKKHNDIETFHKGAKNLQPDKIIKYFYLDYLSSVFRFHLSIKSDRTLMRDNDLRKIDILNEYQKSHLAHFKNTVYLILETWKFNDKALENGDEKNQLVEIKKFVNLLKKSPIIQRKKHFYRPITRYILCGPEVPPEISNKFPKYGIAGDKFYLYGNGKNGNVNFRKDQIEETLGRKLSPESRDLLEIAGYIYVGDNLISRGPRWRRSIHFVIPVRKYQFWKKMTDHLNYSLSFLTGDSISFEFYRYPQPEKSTSTKKIKRKKINADCTTLLSGGIDSFAGNLKMIKNGKTPLIISHFFQNTIANQQQKCVEYLREKAEKSGKNTPEHLRLKIGKQITKKNIKKSKEDKTRTFPDLSKINNENSQRTRSFLYFSLAGIAASELRLPEVCITENGLSSFNLPITPSYASTRCGRPTNPRNIFNFSQLVNGLYKKDMYIHNPYSLKTKSELIKEAVSNQDDAKQMNDTITCAKYWLGILCDARRKKRHCTHCGGCYECILRLASLYGADIAPDFDKYLVNPYKNLEKLTDYEMSILVLFINYCHNIERTHPSKLILRYPDLCLPRQYFPDEKQNDISKTSVSMHKKFASDYLNWLGENGGDKIKQITDIFKEKPPRTIDVHCHVDQYPDPFQIVAKAKNTNTKIVSVGTDLRSNIASIKLSQYSECIIPAVGIHPLDIPHLSDEEIEHIFRLFDRADIIGEIGLDYYFEKNKKHQALQREVLWKILEHCKGKNKIFNIHSKGAEEDLLDMLEKFDAKKVVFHWYSGPMGLLSRIQERKYYISVNKAIFNSQKIKQLVQHYPKSLILTESDGPGPRKSFQNSPFYIPKVISAIAKIWKIPDEQAQKQIYENFMALVLR